MSSQDSMFLPSLPGRAAPWDTSSAHNRHWGQSPVSPAMLAQAISLPFPPLSLQMSLCVTNVCVPAPQAAAAHLPGQSPASHILACDDLRLCNHLMGCSAAVSFPKVSNNISAGSFKFYAEISKWPTKMTSFVFRKYSVHILVFVQFWGTHFALRAWLSHKLPATKFCTPG